MNMYDEIVKMEEKRLGVTKFPQKPVSTKKENKLYLVVKIDNEENECQFPLFGDFLKNEGESFNPENFYISVQELVNSLFTFEDVDDLMAYLIQQFYAVACVPSSILGQSNVANVSETSITMLYQQTSNFNRQFITEMTKGFMQRMEYIRKLMEIQGQTVTDEVFDSINFLFNVSKPVDNEANMNNMKIQYDCGAISKQTIIDKSPYTTDTALELQRLQDEAKVSQEIEELTPVPDTKTEEIVIDDENN